MSLLSSLRPAGLCSVLGSCFVAASLPLRYLCTEAQARPQQQQDQGETREELEERKRRAVQQYLDERLGNPDPQRSALAQLLQQHGVVVRGGQREALRLLEALEEWKRGTWKPATPEGSAADAGK